MSLAHIEELCRSQHIPYQKEEDGLILNLKGAGHVVFPTMVSQQKCGDWQAFLWFPSNHAARVEEADTFCGYIEEVFSFRVRVGFSEKENQFWAGRILDVREFIPSLGVFVAACDLLLPLFLRVGYLGSWHQDLVSLACLAPEDCAGRA